MKKISSKKVRVTGKSGFIINSQFLFNCTAQGFVRSLSKNDCSEVTRVLTTILSWLEKNEYWSKNRCIYVLDFVHSSANQNGNSTRLNANMTSSYVTDHVILELSVFIVLIQTWHQMTLLFREGKSRGIE